MHFKQNNKESKTYVQGLRPFGNTLPKGIKGMLKKNGYNYSEIISKWSMLAGKEISNFCYPKSIKMTQKNKSGTLILSVERGNEINVEYSKREIINKINSYFGYKLIDEIKIKTFNAIKNKSIKENERENTLLKFSKKFEREIGTIKNKDIRNSLAQLLDLAKK